MPTSSRLLSFLLILAVTRVSVIAADKGTSPEERIRAFYQWYLPLLDKDIELAQNRAKLAPYATTRLLDEIDRLSKIEGGLEADPFLAAQDFDVEWATHLTVKDVVVEGKRAQMRVVFTGKSFKHHAAKVRLRLEERAWKIDRVEPVDG